MRLIFAIAALLLVVVLIGKQLDRPIPTREANPEFIKAVHYFAAAWPKTFWEDFENSAIDADLKQIKEDGFNTVILVIPWLGFETGFADRSPAPTQLYERLEHLLERIDESGLDYALRVGFPHSFDPDIDIGKWELCHAIFVDEVIRDQWKEYLSRIAERVNQHRDSFKTAFFSWEDFFCPYSSIPGMPLEQRQDIARLSGYQDWVQNNYSHEMLELLYQQSFDSLEGLAVPERRSPAFLLFMRYVDEFLIRELLIPGREAIPELAMEVRVDKDPVYDGDRITWTGHDLALTDDQLRGSYWGPYHGARNEGEFLSAEEALRNFDYMLDRVSDNGKRINHVVEQFNFVDNTPNFVGHHAQIDEKELPEFLQGAAPLLMQKSSGYGLWSYRDYADSALYNGSFELGLRGWGTNGDVNIVTNVAGDLALSLQAGGSVSQSFLPYDRFAALGLGKQLTFCANFTPVDTDARVTLSINDLALEVIEVSEAKHHCTELDIEAIKSDNVVFSLSSDTGIQLDDLQLFAFVQKLNVYNLDGTPGKLREWIYKLNTEWLGN